MTNKPTTALEVYYDGSCRYCTRQKNRMVRRDRHQRILFTDLTNPGPAGLDCNIPMDRLMAEIHARTAAGEIFSGVEALRRIYSVFGLSWLVALTRLPGIAHLLDLLYKHIARNRYKLAGRCRDNACRKD
jgi:predicted DCC family thiol-disulfide oxidoreductase YuxK